MAGICLYVVPVSVAPWRVHYWVVVFQPRTAAMETLDSFPLKFKVTMCCTRLSSLPDGVQSVSPPSRSTSLHWSRLRPGTPPLPLYLLWSRQLRRLPQTPSPSTPSFPAPPLLMLLPPSMAGM